MYVAQFVGEYRYVYVQGEKDWAKYEVARKLKELVDRIRAQYREDWKSKEMRVRQRAVAVYFIDKLALRAGNEKDSDETADTVGCCSLRVEHISKPCSDVLYTSLSLSEILHCTCTYIIIHGVCTHAYTYTYIYVQDFLVSGKDRHLKQSRTIM